MSSRLPVISAVFAAVASCTSHTPASPCGTCAASEYCCVDRCQPFGSTCENVDAAEGRDDAGPARDSGPPRDAGPLNDANQSNLDAARSELPDSGFDAQMIAHCDAGSHAVGGACYPDGPGTGALVLSPTSPIRIVPSGRTCFDVSVIAADGTMSPAPEGSASIRTADPSLALAAAPDDCLTVGVLGVAPGTTTATVSVSTTSGVLEAPIVVVVVAGDIGIEIDPLTVGVGRTTTIPVLSSSTPYLLDAHFTPSLLRLDVANGALASVARGTTPGWIGSASAYPNRFELTGLAVGTTTMSITHGGHSLGTATVTVAGPPVGVVLDGNPPALELYRGYTSVSQPVVLHPGDCIDVELQAWLVDAAGIRYFDVIDAPTWSVVGGTAVRVDRPGRRASFCGSSSGGVLIQGCSTVGGMMFCAQEPVAVYADGEVTGLNAVIGAPTPFVLPTATLPSRWCPNLRAMLTLASGASTDVTRSPALRWLNSFSFSGPMVTRLVVDGAPYFDASGNPCFTGSVPVDVHALGVKSVYGDVFFDVSIPIAPVGG